MIIGARDLSCDEACREMNDVISHSHAGPDEVFIFVDAHDCEKLNLITGFAEILLGCTSRVADANGYYVVRIKQSPVEGILRG